VAYYAEKRRGSVACCGGDATSFIPALERPEELEAWAAHELQVTIGKPVWLQVKYVALVE